MQLKIKRSQRDGGIIGKTAIFQLDVRAEYTAQEQVDIKRYKLHNQAVYNSEASKRHLAQAALHADGSAVGELKALGFSILHRMKLNITVKSLADGHHIECKDLEEMIGAEEALVDACKTLKQFLDTAATFDGREVVIDFPGEMQIAIAASATPGPALIASPDAPPPSSGAAPALPPPQSLHYEQSGGAAAAAITAPRSVAELIGTDPGGRDWLYELPAKWKVVLFSAVMLLLLSPVACLWNAAHHG